ncbi:SGNH/GDSL hydrolase family protein [Polaribacter sp. SA4-12]|uniref:SGNH/GDSL hydrolase family protein n=1 Tax=Polaribacter sp. SA4-12 TaxID=1312072 RepID=UPI000B3CD7A0|nr:SGNH/GDSL hydrolase family protein [Polaribacter sp. SA4-12]ARV16576.1 hypothetical protein BTO07_16160 [Polaribacter sp. SA4-12]
MKKYTFILLLFIVCNLQSQNSNISTFKKGDRIVFIGNSITHDGRYHNFFQIYNATRFPNEKVAYFNAGIAGDVANGMIRRFESDILVHKPTHAFLMTGMNDVNRWLYTDKKPDANNLKQRQETLDKYILQTEELAKRLVENNINPIFITPSIYDQTGIQNTTNDFGTNDGLSTFALHIKRMAKKYNAPLVDFQNIMLSINKKEQAKDSTFTIVGPDRIHPQDIGHLVMAFEMIRTIAPTEYISKTIIDARKNKVKESFNSEVVFEEKSNDFEFKMLEKSLPFPIKEAFQKVNKLVPLNKTLNNEILVVKRLKKGNYKLLIDDDEIGFFACDDLKRGINLANYQNTPQYKQAIKVSEIVNVYHKTQDSLRNITFVEFKMMGDYKGDNTLASKKEFLIAKNEKDIGKSWYEWNKKNIQKYFVILPKEKELWRKLKMYRDEIYTANKPKWHRFKLVKQ